MSSRNFAMLLFLLFGLWAVWTKAQEQLACEKRGGVTYEYGRHSEYTRCE